MATKRKYRATVKNFDETSENMQILNDHMTKLSNTLKKWRAIINEIDLDAVAKEYPEAMAGGGGLPKPPDWPPPDDS